MGIRRSSVSVGGGSGARTEETDIEAGRRPMHTEWDGRKIRWSERCQWTARRGTYSTLRTHQAVQDPRDALRRRLLHTVISHTGSRYRSACGQRPADQSTAALFAPGVVGSAYRGRHDDDALAGPGGARAGARGPA